MSPISLSSLTNNHYNFVGKLQYSQHLDCWVIKEAAKEYERRIWVIWTSALSIPRKVKATNTYAALPSLPYYMRTTDWPINTLRDLDRLTRKIINECHSKHRHESTQFWYLPSKRLIQIEALYKYTKIKAAHYINTSNDVHIKLLKSFQKKKEDRNSRMLSDLRKNCS